MVLQFQKPSSTTAAATTYLLLLTTLLSVLSTPTNADTSLSTSAPPLPPPLPYNDADSKASSFRPSIAIIVGVLTTVFSITFLLLLYAKHCKRGTFVVVGHDGAASSGPRADRKNSGIDRAVVESLPVFRFGSLRGLKDGGLDCAVCLTRFEPAEVLRLLPKCKHAFHVECVDTWLDAHSTCPLCRYRVDPEDILLIEDVKLLRQYSQPLTPRNDVVLDIANDPQFRDFRRVSGRHSSALEHRPWPCDQPTTTTSSFRRSLDSWTMFRKKSRSESATVGCLERPRKDGLLLSQDRARLEHRIIVSSPRSSNSGGFHQRWSDVHPSDLLYLQSEMIMSDSTLPRQQQKTKKGGNVVRLEAAPAVEEVVAGEGINGSGSSVINGRSVSEITGLDRFSGNERRRGQNHRGEQQRQLKLVSNWLAWISSHAHSRPAVRSDRTAETPPPTLPTVATTS